MQQLDPMLLDIQEAVGAHNLRLGQLMRKANLRACTWSDWTTGRRSPKLENVRAVQAALAELIAEKQ